MAEQPLHKRFFLETVLNTHGQCYAGEFKYQVCTGLIAPAKSKAVSAFAYQADIGKPKAFELRDTQRNPVFQFFGIRMRKQIHRLLFRNIKVADAFSGHDSV